MGAKTNASNFEVIVLTGKIHNLNKYVMRTVGNYTYMAKKEEIIKGHFGGAFTKDGKMQGQILK